jgi:hypothetical protein
MECASAGQASSAPAGNLKCSAEYLGAHEFGHDFNVGKVTAAGGCSGRAAALGFACRLDVAQAGLMEGRVGGRATEWDWDLRRRCRMDLADNSLLIRLQARER